VSTASLPVDFRALVRKRWFQFILLCIGLTIAYYASSPLPSLAAIWYTLVGLAALAAIAIGIRGRTANPWAWIWIGIGMLFYFTGDAIFNCYRLVLHVPRPFPTIADAFFLLARFPLIVGLIQLTRRTKADGSAFSVLDTLVIASGLSLLWWAFLMAPQAYNTQYSPLVRFIAVAYPAADFLLLATGIRLAFTSARRTAPIVMLEAALVCLLTADVVYSVLQLRGVYQVGSLLDLGWIWFYAFIGAVALHPEPDIKPVPATLNSRYLAIRFGLLTLAALLLPVSIAISRIAPQKLDWPTVILGTTLIILVMLRLQRLMQQNLGLQRELSVWKSDMLFKSIVNQAYSGVSILKSDLSITYSNPRMSELADVTGSDPSLEEILHPDDTDRFQAFWQDTLSSTRDIPSVEYRLRDPSGRWRDVESTSNNLIGDEWIRGVVLITQDISGRKRFERKLKNMAYTDSLTSLPNRAALTEYLEQAVDQAAAERSIAAVAFIDLDNFKEINDSLGHTIGDRVLLELARRLQGLAAKHSFVARFGGDEFVLVATGLGHSADAQVLFSARLAHVLDRAIHLDSYEIYLTAGVGIALSRRGKVSGSEVLENSSVALHQAKTHGRSSSALYNSDLANLSKQRRALSQALHEILRRPGHAEALSLMLKPIHNLSTGALVGAEIITAWHHDEFGSISQAELASVASESDLLAELEARTLSRACELLGQWSPLLRSHPFRLHVHVSAASYRAPNYDRVILENLAASKASPKNLVLEVASDNLQSNFGAAVASLGSLKDKDVGTVVSNIGESSTAAFPEFARIPGAHIKIDGPSALGGASRDSLVILEGIIGIAHRLDRLVISDGIDSSAQAEDLRQLGCDLGQGTLYHGSITTADMEALLNRL
jgi:diguanylate cyclase (GGDEF)-like protein/PAS domain S-box-containing protein